MNYIFTKVSKKVSDMVISSETKEIQMNSLTFEELLNYTGSASELHKEIKKYKDLKSRKSVQSTFLKYKDVLDRKITDSYTEQDKNNDVSAFESKHAFVTDLSLIPEYEDKRLNKILNRKKIGTSVRDTDDSIADLAKWISLLTSMNFSIYNALSSTAKNNIPQDERALIESCQEIFKNTETIGDLALAEQGVSLIKKIMAREQKITKIIKGEF